MKLFSSQYIRTDIAVVALFLLSACRDRNDAMWESPSINQKNQTATSRASFDRIYGNQQIGQAAAIQQQNGDSAKKMYLYEALNYIKSGYSKGAANAFAHLGVIYSREGKDDSALLYLNYSLPFAKVLHFEPGIMSAIYTCIGDVYYRQMKLDSAAEYMYKGLATLDQQEIQGYLDAFHAYRSIGIWWTNMDNMETAAPYLDKAAGIAVLHNDSTILMDIQCIRATVYQKRKMTDSALSLYNEILGNPRTSLKTQIEVHYNIGTIFCDAKGKNEPARAIPHLKKCLDLSLEIKSHSPRTDRYLFGLAVAYMNVTQKKEDFKYQRNIDEILESMARMTNKAELGEDLVHFYKSLSKFYAKHKKYQKAYAQCLLAASVRDSLSQKEQLIMVNKMDFRYRISHTDKLLAEQQLQLTRQQNRIQQQYLWIIGMCSLALLGTIALIGLWRRKRHYAEMDRLKSMMSGEERERIRMSRELHDGIVNQLSAIKMSISSLPTQHPSLPVATTGFLKVLQQLEQSIVELRLTSHNLQPEILEQAGIAGALHIYCKKLSESNSVTIEFLFIGQLPKLSSSFQLTLYRILQALIQKIIKQGKATEALLQFNADTEHLVVTLDDNGSGILPHWEDEEGTNESNHLYQRIKSINGKLEVEATKGEGSSFYFYFDLRPHKAES